MGLAFLTPLFFAGIGLLAAPFFIHQIRRPEREPHRFSSLLFIPNVEKEVIERKRIQHILLMLLRMLALLLLALAFARPYWQAQGAVAGENGSTQHIILLDTSYSMGHEDVFDKARAEALGVLTSIAENEPFALMSFGSNADVLVPIRDQDGQTASNRENARTAINRAEVTADHTDYRLALESAYRHLTTGAAVDPTNQPRVVFHVITDFMKNGLPLKASGWKLPAYVEVETISVGDLDIENLGVTDIGVRKYPNGDLRVLVKVQNWTDEKRENIEVKLDLNGTEIAENLLTIQAGSTRQSSFRITQEQMVGEGETLTGQVKLVDDSMQTDNTRYFTWSMPRKQRILLVGLDREEMRWPPVRLVEQALPNRNELPWLRETIEVGDLVDSLNKDGLATTLVILSDYESLNGDVLITLRDYVQGGGQVLVCASATEGLSGIDVTVFGNLGVSGSEPKYEKPRASRYTMMSWVNLEHPLFIPFQGHKFNDFSSLRFFNYVPITVDEDAEGVQVLARFEDDEPAMVEARSGDGRIIIWAFSPQLSWTNMPKTSRFVPLLHETVMYMTDSTGEAGEWSVGDATDEGKLAWNTGDTTIILEPNAESERTIARGEFAQIGTLNVPGFFKSKALAESDWEVVRAINVEGREGDDTPVSEAEFLLKLATAPMLNEEATAQGVVGTEVDEEGFVIETEYGRGLLAALLLLILIEMIYMSVLSTREGLSKPTGSA